MKQEHYLEAVDLLLPETDRYPRRRSLRSSGFSLYGMENLSQAIIEWNKALGIHDNAAIRQAIEKAQRANGRFPAPIPNYGANTFLLRYEGQQIERLSGQILNSLEGSYQSLVLDQIAPAEVIVVLLYPSQSFAISRSPSWVGALNDGKIRCTIFRTARR